MSTDPKATVNYFNAAEHDLPYELSPAFFRPEVLSKYKTDREKYTITDRSVSCRTAWYLQSYDVNETGQVHASLCYLRRLPYAEQLHWLSFNEEPKAGISARAYTNDFEGRFVNFVHPREHVISIARQWHDRPVEWWKLRSPELLERANTPLTSSKDEWADAIMDLAKLVVEGFEICAIQRRLSMLGESFKADEKTIALLQRLTNHGRHPDEPFALSGLREMQLIRSKVKGHAGGSEARKIATNAIANHGSYKEHFTDLCGRVAEELQGIASCFELIA